jgi:hypothetical protein
VNEAYRVPARLVAGKIRMRVTEPCAYNQKDNAME